jgi:alkylation response protein AidB-like acyl-CoA dehydrogenase
VATAINELTGAGSIRDSFFEAPGPDWDFVARATALQPLLRNNAAASEAQRRVVDESIEALVEAGLFSIAVPKRFGGAGQNFRTFIETVSEIAKGDGSVAWVTALTNVCTWFATLFSEQAQQDVFGANPKARVCGIFTPAQSCEPVDGGLSVSGSWNYGSGCMWADWGTLGVQIGTLPDGSPELGLALIPISELHIEDTWKVAGMAATASNTLVADGIFVPSHRIQSFAAMAAEDYAREYDEEPNYYASFVPVAALVLIAAQIGLGRAALELTLTKGATKSVAYTVFGEAKESPAHQIATAKAATEIDAAYLLAIRACADIDTRAERHEKLDPLTRARIRMDTGKCGELIRGAINRLLSVNGASSFATANALNRIWRDSEIASRHAFVHPEFAELIYGRVLYGITEPVQPY